MLVGSHSSDFSLLVVGLLISLTGLGIYLYSVEKADRYAFTFNVLSWLLLPVFPLVFILWAFPGSTAEGELFKIKVGGALAAYLLMWVAGVQFTKRAIVIDDLRSEVAELEKKCDYVAVIKEVNEGARAKPLHEAKKYSYEVIKVPKKHICIRTGDIVGVHGVDVWVNSENTDMQMARFQERSLSSIIRYSGAKKDPKTGLVHEDTIADELREILEEVKLVAPAMVVVTSAGELASTNGVKRIFHVASVHGLPASAYRPIERLGDCVTNCLRECDVRSGEGLASILFPLMGTGVAGGTLEASAQMLVNAAINYFEQYPSSKVDEVSFLAYTDVDLAICRKTLMESDRVKEVTV